MAQERVEVEAIRNIEEQRREDVSEQQAALIQKRGDTGRAFLNSRFISLAVIAFIIGIVAENPFLIALSGFLLTVAFMAWQWSRNSLVGVRYQRRFHHTHVFPNETTDVEIMIENRKWLPATWLTVEDTWPLAFAPTDEHIILENMGNQFEGLLSNAYTLRWYERIRRNFELQGRSRGIYDVGPAALSSGDPWGLFERLLLTSRSRRDYLVVYPEFLPLEALGFPLRDPLGDNRVRRRLFEDPSRVIGIRNYQPQDSFRDIHWKATARTGQMQSKVYEPTRGVNVVLAVNIASFEEFWRGVWPEMLEYTLSVAASLANWAAEKDHSFGLIANGAYARADQSIRILPSRRPSQLKHVLEALAGIKYFVTKEFGRHILDESPRLPIGATVVLVTPFISDMIAQSSVRLKAHGRQMVWVVLGPKAPAAIPGIPLHHLPIPEGAMTITDEMQAFGNEETEEIARRRSARERFLQQRAENYDDTATPEEEPHAIGAGETS